MKGQKVSAVIAGNNGILDGNQLMYTYEINDEELILVEINSENPFQSIIYFKSASVCFLNTGDDPLFQAGIALLTDKEGKVVLKNLDIIRYPGCFKEVIKNNFDTEPLNASQPSNR